MKILCIEDDEGLAKLLQRSLNKQHYRVEIAIDGQQGWELIQSSAYDLILLDWMLPSLTGIEICQRLRAGLHLPSSPNQDTPILLMTALDAVTNKVLGLDAGADDYVVKPFDFDEILARIRALLRRSQKTRSPLLQWGALCLHPSSCEVTYRGSPITLAAKEYELLELFLRNPEQIFSLDRLLFNLWTTGGTPSEGAVRAHIKGLRQKLKQAGAEDPIDTLYKLGYRLKQRQDRRTMKDEPTAEELSTPEAQGTASLAEEAPPTADRMTEPSSIPPEFLDVWQECRQSYCDRLLIIETAVTALEQGSLTPDQQQSAAQEAHTLIGSLGSFGLTEASHLSRQVQQLLKGLETLGPDDLAQLKQLIAQLKKHLEPSIPLPAEPEPLEEIAFSETLPLEFGEEKGSPKGATSSPFPSLLIVEDDFSLAQMLAKEASLGGWQVTIATTLKDAQQSFQASPFDTILLDIHLSDTAGNGLDFLAMVRRQAPDLPVVMLTADENFEDRVEAARLGSRCFLQKPIAPAQVLTALAQVLQQASRSSAHILIVDDDPALLQILCNLLQPCGYRVTTLSQPQAFWQTLEQAVPDLLILDVELCQPPATLPSTDALIPPLSGIELCQVIRSDLRWNRVPVLFLSAYADIETVQRSFAAGADDFLSKPVVPLDLLTRIKTRLEQRKLWQATELDELTGVSLRRKALLDLTRLMRLAQRQSQPLSLALIDLDHFKQVNDRYGHSAGDQVLRYVGQLLHQLVRQEDVVGRWGGEEFIVGMYGIHKEVGVRRLEEVLGRLRQFVFQDQSDEPFQVTFSAGVSQLPEDGSDLQRLYCVADQALYRAKAAGRKQIFSS